jgi:uncharacterized membrane protein YedE/YeeE
MGLMRAVISFLTGGLFGAGLLVSGMTDTAKVQGWLDYFGAWDPTLAFVLGGAILPMLIAWRVAAKRSSAVLGNAFPMPSPPILDRNLIGGAALFGFGWAVVGLCPGPAMAVLAWGGTEAIVFFVAMIAGMTLARIPSLKSRGADA